MLDRFVSLYSTAVKKRLRTSKEVGATLSSGLDSTSVCILAARGLEPYGKELHSWTSVPHYPNEAFSFGRWMTDEGSLAVKSVTGIKNIKHDIVDAASANPIDSILVHQRIGKGETGLGIMRDCSRVLLPGLSVGLFLASFDTDFKLISNYSCCRHKHGFYW